MWNYRASSDILINLDADKTCRRGTSPERRALAVGSMCILLTEHLSSCNGLLNSWFRQRDVEVTEWPGVEDVLLSARIRVSALGLW